jgi:hypothetical protein
LQAWPPGQLMRQGMRASWRLKPNRFMEAINGNWGAALTGSQLCRYVSVMFSFNSCVCLYILRIPYHVDVYGRLLQSLGRP